MGRATPRWAFMQGFQIVKDGKPYLDRLRIVQTPYFSVLLHRIHTPDQDRDPHDHPWWFASFLLSGSYEEHIWHDPRLLSQYRTRIRPRFSLRTVGFGEAHMIYKVDGLLWTLVLTGPRRREFRFWTEDGPVDWREYLKAGADSDSDPW